MNFEQFNNIFEENFEENFEPEFPLFNFDALRKAESEEEFALFNIPFPFDEPTFLAEIPQKKVKLEEPQKKRGRKPADKNAKAFNDPTITIEQIINNDLAGIPMKAEVLMKEKQLKDMRAKKALKKANREKGLAIEPEEKAFALEPLFPLEQMVDIPRIIFRDGKIVVNEPVAEEKGLKLEVREKPRKITSMSFRTKNHTARWTPEETKKFFKAMEIFGADFDLIAKIFPNRNREQIKNKFNKEDKANRFAVDEALTKNTVLNKRPFINLYNSLTNETELLALENDFEPEEGLLLERNVSNVSVETGKIIGEIKEAFLKELKPKPLALPQFNFMANENVPQIGENKEGIFKESLLIAKKENLLFKFMI